MLPVKGFLHEHPSEECSWPIQDRMVLRVRRFSFGVHCSLPPSKFLPKLAGHEEMATKGRQEGDDL